MASFIALPRNKFTFQWERASLGAFIFCCKSLFRLWITRHCTQKTPWMRLAWRRSCSTDTKNNYTFKREYQKQWVPAAFQIAWGFRLNFSHPQAEHATKCSSTHLTAGRKRSTALRIALNILKLYYNFTTDFVTWFMPLARGLNCRYSGVKTQPKELKNISN